MTGPHGGGSACLSCYPLRGALRAPRLSTRFASCSPNSVDIRHDRRRSIWAAAGVAQTRRRVDGRATMMARCLCARTAGGSEPPCRPTRNDCDRLDADARRGAARWRSGPRSNASTQLGKLTARERLDLLLDPGLVRRARCLRHASRHRIRPGRATTSSATASSPATARSTAGSSSSSARTSPSSADRCRRRTPRRSARSWISR